VIKIDWLARSTSEPLTHQRELADKGVAFKFTDDHRHRVAHRKARYGILALIAKFEKVYRALFYLLGTSSAPRQHI
jgi:hypothetical protein